MRMLRRVEYLAKIEEEVLYEIMFNLKSVSYEAGENILSDKE